MIRNNLYITLILDILFYPILLISHWWKVIHYNPGEKLRSPVLDTKIKVCIHEWGGYAPERKKTLKNGVIFNCGLKGQIERFSNKKYYDTYITMSDKNLWNYDYMFPNLNIIEVDNNGMDFSGYSKFYSIIKKHKNSYVILTNSSVNSISEDFIDDYIKYMEKNKDVGALGISYCTKMIQTFIRPNFYPHIQSFFILTTTEVLNEIVKLNSGRFPGNDLSNKLMIIRFGEIKISQLILKAGYNISVVNPVNGVPYKFNSYKDWNLIKGDIRLHLKNPNKITKINNNHSLL